MRSSRWAAAALFVAGVVLVVEAQQPRQPGGGFGGGQNVTAQVISNKDLQDELKVTDAQKDKFKVVADKQTEARKKFGEAFKGGKGGFDKEKFADLQKENEKVTAEVTKVVDETLTPDQKKRLKQLERQLQGVRAFASEDVAAELKLSDAQKTKIKGITDDYSKDVGELFGGRGKGGFGKGGFDKDKQAENQKKREKLSKTAMADIEEVLNADQQKAWKEMVGAPFDTSKLRQGGFGGGFGGGRPTPKKGD
jgi:Spy/CpxP family protein refolding chaperone